MKIEKVGTVICYALVSIILVTLFIENFIYSSNLGQLSFRAIDDLAFHESLRKIHLIIQNMDYAKFWVLNEYAYGWIFWAPMAVITYPLYILNQSVSIAWPLIILPRQISFVFVVLSLVILRKYFKKINTPEWGCAVALLIFSLFPTFGYFSMRFGTVNEVMFFSMLSFFLAQHYRPSTPRSRLLIAFILAISGSIKLSGLLIAPLVFMFVVRNLPKKNWLYAAQALLIPGAVFIVTLLIFTNPALLIAPFKPKIGVDYWNTLRYFIASTKTVVDPLNSTHRFLLGVFQTPLQGFATFLLMLGFIPCWIKIKESRFDIIAIMLTIILVAGYLILSVKNLSGIVSYFTSISFLLLLGVCGWAQTKPGPAVLVLIILMLFTDVVIRAKLQSPDSSEDKYALNHLSYFIKFNQSKQFTINAQKAEACIQTYANLDGPEHIFVDYTIPIMINSLNYPKVCVSVAWNNLSPLGKYCDRPINFLILDKLAIGYLPVAKFEARLKKVSDSKVLANTMRDRASRNGLSASGNFAGQHFKLICEYGTIKVFKAGN